MWGLAWGMQGIWKTALGHLPGSQGMCKVPGERDIYMATDDEWDLVRHRGKEGAEKKGRSL